MTVPRYTVPGWPAQVAGHAAVTPNLTRMAGSGAVQYKDRVNGQPGTQAIPVNPVIPASSGAAHAMMGLSRSSDAPNVFYPNLYWAAPERAFWPGAGMPVSVRSDNLMPVPAVDPRGIPSTQFVPINQRGLKQVSWVPALPKWASVNAT